LALPALERLGDKPTGQPPSPQTRKGGVGHGSRAGDVKEGQNEEPMEAGQQGCPKILDKTISKVARTVA